MKFIHTVGLPFMLLYTSYGQIPCEEYLMMKRFEKIWDELESWEKRANMIKNVIIEVMPMDQKTWSI
jgi:purine-cytosine permease-like protein